MRGRCHGKRTLGQRRVHRGGELPAQPEAIADELGVPLAVVSRGRTWRDKSQVPKVLR